MSGKAGYGVADWIAGQEAERAELLSWFTKAGGDPGRLNEWTNAGTAAKEAGRSIPLPREFGPKDGPAPTV